MLVWGRSVGAVHVWVRRAGLAVWLAVGLSLRLQEPWDLTSLGRGCCSGRKQSLRVALPGALPCAALQELCRVLKPGATVAILDFNYVQNPAVDAFQVGCGAVVSWWWRGRVGWEGTAACGLMHAVRPRQ